MKHSTKFYKNQFKGGDFTYADAVKYVDSRTVRSVNLITPSEKAEQNWQQLKYEDAKRRAEQMYRHDVGLRVQDAIVSFVIVFITFAAMALVIANYSH